MGIPTHRLELTARFDASCSTVRGRVRGRRAVSTWVAVRSTCGDGRIDPGAGEECEGEVPATATCPGDPSRDASACLACLPTCRLAPRTLAVPRGEPTIRLAGSGRFATVEVDAAAYADWRLARPSRGQVQEVTARLYRTFDDVFDFVILMSDEDAVAAGAAAYGRHWQVRNDTQGIGASAFDFTGYFGSDGRLQGVIELPARGGIHGPLLHELMHRWGNHLRDWPMDTLGGHWGFTSVGGQLGGWAEGTLVDHGGGLYAADGPLGQPAFGRVANGGNAVPYAGLELYLMGLVAAADVVAPLDAAAAAVFVDPEDGTFRADRILSRTLADVVAVAGPRVPDVQHAQRDFRALLVLVGTGPADPTALRLLDDAIERFGRTGDDGQETHYNFWEATGGRATMRLDGLFAALRTTPAPVTSSLRAATAHPPEPIRCVFPEEAP